MRKFELLTFYTFRECLIAWGGILSTAPTIGLLGGNALTAQIVTMTGADNTDPADPIFSALPFYSYSTTNTRWELDSRAVAVLNLLSTRYSSNYVGWGETEEEATKSAFDRYIAAILSSWDRYSVLLKNYEDTKAKMMDPVETETASVSRVKDTPQTEIDPFSDGYNAAVTANTGTAKEGRETNAVRLRELWDYYRGILRDWSDEIGKIFLDFANI